MQNECKILMQGFMSFFRSIDISVLLLLLAYNTENTIV